MSILNMLSQGWGGPFDVRSSRAALDEVLHNPPTDDRLAPDDVSSLRVERSR